MTRTKKQLEWIAYRGFMGNYLVWSLTPAILAGVTGCFVYKNKPAAIMGAFLAVVFLYITLSAMFVWVRSTALKDQKLHFKGEYWTYKMKKKLDYEGVLANKSIWNSMERYWAALGLIALSELEEDPAIKYPPGISVDIITRLQEEDTTPDLPCDEDDDLVREAGEE